MLYSHIQTVKIAVSSCGPVKYSSSENLNLKSVQTYAFIEPVADVLYYDRKNKPVYDCNMYCVVIDSDCDEIAHYIHPLPFLEKDPLNGRDMETMINRLLKDFRE